MQTGQLNGTFALSWQGAMTVDLTYDATAVNVQTALQDLPEVGIVSVTRSVNTTHGTHVWTVTFQSVPGDLPLIVAYPGRLTPLSHGAALTVTEKVAGSPAVLVYDGTSAPEVRSYTVSNLNSDMTFAFKVLPFNFLGKGILSAPTVTTIPRSGASPIYTTASGTALQTGITYRVDEQQVVRTFGCKNSTWSIGYNATSLNATFSNNRTALSLAQTLMHIIPGHIPVQVERFDNTSGPSSILDQVTYLITFVGAKNVPLLWVAPSSLSAPGCSITVATFLEGNLNSFLIEPKQASGAVLVDSATPSYQGQDLFLTESYTSDGQWYRDQGIATYNPTTYEIQQIVVPSDGRTVRMSLQDYLTPNTLNTTMLLANAFAEGSTAVQVQTAIEGLGNVAQVDVSITKDTSNTYYTVTFLSNLGSVPLMQVNAGGNGVYVQRLQGGVTEVQTITLASDVQDVREVQQFWIPALFSATLSLSFASKIWVDVATPSGSLTENGITQALRTIVGTDNSTLTVTVTSASLPIGGNAGTTWTVTFLTPVGNVPALGVSLGTQGTGTIYASTCATWPPTTTTCVYTVTQGKAPSTGTFTVYYEGSYTADIPYNGGAAVVKKALEALSNIGTVQVLRDDTTNGFKWTVMFTQNSGNLRMMVASPYRYEVQQIQTTGGSPTPLSGALTVSFGGDSVTVSSDVTEIGMASALQSMPSVGNVQVARTSQPSGQYTWLVTFRALVGNVNMLAVDYSMLYGTSAKVCPVHNHR